MKELIRKTLTSFLILVFLFQTSGIPSLVFADDYYEEGGTSPSQPASPEDNPFPRAHKECDDTDPVSLCKGDLTVNRADFFLPGRKMPVAVTLTYRNRSSYNGFFGYGWDMNYNLKLKRITGGNVVLLSGENRKDEFIFDGNQYTAPSAIYSSLVENQDGTFTLTYRGGSKEFYDINGNLSRAEDRNGNAFTFSYEGPVPIIGKSDYFVNQTTGVIAREYRLTQITDTVGRNVIFGYNSDGRLESITYAGRATTYTYGPSGNGDLIAVTTPATNEYPEGLTTQYAYDSKHNLLSITDPKNQTYVSNVYDEANDRVTSQTWGTGTTTMIYGQDEQGRSTTKTIDHKNFETDWTFNEFSEPIKQVQKTVPLRPGDPAFYTTEWTYNSNQEVTRVVYPRGNAVEYKYNENNENPLARGNLIEVRRKKIGIPPGQDDPTDIVASFTYESNYQFIKTVTDPKGKVTTYTYDYELGEPNKGNLRRITYPLVNDQTPEVEFTYNTFGQVETITDPNENVTKFEYDSPTGYLIKITSGFGAPEAAVTQFAYDNFGNITTVTDANGRTATLQYNEFNQLTRLTSAPPFNLVTNYFYDENGNVRQVDRQGQITRFTYTPLDQLRTITDALNHVTTFDYDANRNRTSITDANNKVTNYVYDERDLLWKGTNANNETTEYAYDENGSLKELKDSRGNASSYVYDDFDRVEQMVYPDASAEVYAYDKNSNLLTKTDPKNQNITYEYDALNRLIAKHYPDATGIDYFYDVGSRLTGVEAQNYDAAYQYDALSRVKNVTQTIEALSPLTINYKYDTVSNLTQTKYPSGTTLNYTYDEINRLTSIQDRAPSIVNYTYDTLSRRKQAKLGNNTAVDYLYDALNRLVQISNYKLQGGQQPNDRLTGLRDLFSPKNAEALGEIAVPLGTFSFYNYLYDRVGNRTLLRSNQGDESYTYDAIYQLTGVARDEIHNYQYDALGNRTVADGINYATNNLNQYTDVGGTPYTYDANGNLISDGIFTYGYDFDDRLVSVIGNGVNATYTYDPLGRRIKKEVNGEVVYYLHDGNQIIEERNIAGGLEASFVYGTGIDEAITMNRGGSTYYYAYDGLGSVSDLTDYRGEVAESYSYDVFGRPNQPSFVGNPYLFTGRQFDEETGLYYYRARHYHPTIGKFMQRDPLSYLPDINLYRYVRNCPSRWADPLGLDGRTEAIWDTSSSREWKLPDPIQTTSPSYHPYRIPPKRLRPNEEGLLDPIAKPILKSYIEEKLPPPAWIKGINFLLLPLEFFKVWGDYWRDVFKFRKGEKLCDPNKNIERIFREAERLKKESSGRPYKYKWNGKEVYE